VLQDTIEHVIKQLNVITYYNELRKILVTIKVQYSTIAWLSHFSSHIANIVMLQQRPRLIPLSGVGYMDHIMPECYIITHIGIQLTKL